MRSFTGHAIANLYFTQCHEQLARFEHNTHDFHEQISGNIGTMHITDRRQQDTSQSQRSTGHANGPLHFTLCSSEAHAVPAPLIFGEVNGGIWTASPLKDTESSRESPIWWEAGTKSLKRLHAFLVLFPAPLGVDNEVSWEGEGRASPRHSHNLNLT